MADVQSLPAELPIPIDRTGVRGLHFPLTLKDRENVSQTTVARVDLGVNLDARHKGVHMSRFVETLNEWDESLNFQSMRKLLDKVCERLGSSHAWIRFSFPYLVTKTAPSGARAKMAYECAISGHLHNNSLSFLASLEVPVMTVCPCSLAISKRGAHSQRTLIRIRALMTSFIWLEDLVAIAEKSASSQVYPILKRIDEKTVTETAFDNPAFVEDVARHVAKALSGRPEISAFDIDVESLESIHNHNAFACISKNRTLLPSTGI